MPAPTVRLRRVVGITPAGFGTLAAAWLACAVLVGLSLALFGAKSSGHGFAYIGYGADPEIFVWFLNWFPFAWAHNLDLFWTRYVAAPQGMNLAWRTSIPALSLLAAPFTVRFGALAAYNALSSVAPGLAGVGAFWAARELSSRTLPSFVAGLTFGFSSYEMGQSLGHLNLSFTVAVPLLVWAVLRSVRCQWHPVPIALVTGGLFAFQFGVSQEIAASFLVMAAVATAFIWFRDPEFRPALRRLLPAVAGGLGVAFVLASPPVFAMLVRGGASGTIIAPPTNFSTDLLNFVIPTPATLPFGSIALTLSDRFRGNFSEDAGYLGLPLLLLLAIIAIRTRRRRIRLPLELAGLAALLSIGPVLHVGGYVIAPAPWRAVSWIPILHDMMPARFMLYAWLALALGIAAWLAEPHASLTTTNRFSLAVVTLAFCTPNVAIFQHRTHVHIASTFTDRGPGSIPEGSNVLILPFVGNRTAEQYASGMRFKLVAQGYLGEGIVAPYASWRLITPLHNGQFAAIDPQEFAAFLAIYHVDEVLVERNALARPDKAEALLSEAGWRRERAQGSIDFFLPPAQPLAADFQAREQKVSFAAKLSATLAKRERLNVCVIRRIETATGLHPRFVWSFYQRHFTLPLPFETITCPKSRSG